MSFSCPHGFHTNKENKAFYEVNQNQENKCPNAGLFCQFQTEKACKSALKVANLQKNIKKIVNHIKTNQAYKEKYADRYFSEYSESLNIFNFESLFNTLKIDLDAKILDYGAGYGRGMRGLGQYTFIKPKNIVGISLEPSHTSNTDLNIIRKELSTLYLTEENRFDVVVSVFGGHFYEPIFTPLITTANKQILRSKNCKILAFIRLCQFIKQGGYVLCNPELDIELDFLKKHVKKIQDNVFQVTSYPTWEEIEALEVVKNI